MRTVAFLLAALLIALGGLHCSRSTEPGAPDQGSANPPDRTPQDLTPQEQSLLGSSNQFGFKLFQKVAEASAPGDNVFISPLSASYALGMCYNGAAGTTREGMATALELSGLSVEEVNKAYHGLTELLTGLDSTVQMDIANSIWYRLGFPVRQEFIDLNATYFDALVREIDFDAPWAADTINHWVAENTHDKIKEIVTPFEIRSCVMALLDAIYFKGTWTITFDTAATQPETFYLADGSTVQRDLMASDTMYGYFENDLLQAVEIPYGQESFAMVVLLPKTGHSPEDIIAQVTADDWSAWMDGLEVDTVRLRLPKFKLSYEVGLNDMLKAMGIAEAFSPDADFSNIVDGGGIFISQVKQKAFVQVDERGTEAAAVTVVLMPTAYPGGPKWMFVNRPFLFAIRERVSGTVIFIGKIADPVWREE